MEAEQQPGHIQASVLVGVDVDDASLKPVTQRCNLLGDGFGFRDLGRESSQVVKKIHGVETPTSWCKARTRSFWPPNRPCKPSNNPKRTARAISRLPASWTFKDNSKLYSAQKQKKKGCHCR